MMKELKIRFRTVAAVLSAALLIPLFAGCGGQKDEGASGGAETGAETGAGEDVAKGVANQAGSSLADMLAKDRPSMPLPTPLFRQISFDDHVYQFAPGVAGRGVADREVIALEKVRFGLASDSSRVWTMAQMESLNAAGAIDRETRSFPIFSRALVRGDSTEVAKLLADGEIMWYDVPRFERYPMRGVFAKFAERVEEHYRRDHGPGAEEGAAGGHDGDDQGGH